MTLCGIPKVFNLTNNHSLLPHIYTWRLCRNTKPTSLGQSTLLSLCLAIAVCWQCAWLLFAVPFFISRQYVAGQCVSRRPRRYILMRSRTGVDETVKVLKYLYLGKSVISIQRWQACERNCYSVLMEEVESSVSSHLTTVAFLARVPPT